MVRNVSLEQRARFFINEAGTAAHYIVKARHYGALAY
jgi:hypothetical protein